MAPNELSVCVWGIYEAKACYIYRPRVTVSEREISNLFLARLKQLAFVVVETIDGRCLLAINTITATPLPA